MARLIRIIVVLLALVGVAALAAGLWLYAGGISARTTPGPLETAVARRLRSMAIPGGARNLQNPTGQTPDALRSGLEHFADHCAVCHGNDGSGDTEMGRGMYPPAPDMRQSATQSLSDGELFYISSTACVSRGCQPGVPVRRLARRRAGISCSSSVICRRLRTPN